MNKLTKVPFPASLSRCPFPPTQLVIIIQLFTVLNMCRLPANSSHTHTYALAHTHLRSHAVNFRNIRRSRGSLPQQRQERVGKAGLWWAYCAVLSNLSECVCVCGRREIWVPCGVEGVRGSRTGLCIYAPLGPPRRALQRAALMTRVHGWEGSRCSRKIWRWAQQPLLFLSTELCFHISPRMTAMCWKETWNVSQNPTSSFAGFCVLSFFLYIYIFSHCDDCGPIAMAVILTTFHMACGSASSAFYFFYFIHLSHWHRSDETNSEVLSSSDVVGFQRGVNKKQQGPLRIASERRDMISGSRTPLGSFFFFF